MEKVRLMSKLVFKLRLGIVYFLLFSIFPIAGCSATSKEIDCGLVYPEIGVFDQNGRISAKALNSCKLRNGEVSGFSFVIDPMNGGIESIQLVEAEKYEMALSSNENLNFYAKLLNIKSGYEFLQQVHDEGNELYIVYSDPDFLYISSFNKLKKKRLLHRSIKLSSLVGVNQVNIRIIVINGEIFAVSPVTVGASHRCHLSVFSLSENKSEEYVLGDIPNCSKKFQVSVYQKSLFLIGDSAFDEDGINSHLWYIFQEYSKKGFSEKNRGKLLFKDMNSDSP
jgi:hypothetical protein